MSRNWAVDQNQILLDWTPGGGEKVNLKITRRVPLDDDLNAPLFFGEEILQRDLEAPLHQFLTGFISQLMESKDKSNVDYWVNKSLRHIGIDGSGGQYKASLVEARRKVGLRKTGVNPKIISSWP